ncbi:hypothetical protein Tco_0874675 [Tanacetum coccineum]|uniref:Uncharacterized protein n=1 Tax=Tanacetum coccineum TaxID=301880 RepID=A0ABQ5BSX9_9ASTR
MVYADGGDKEDKIDEAVEAEGGGNDDRIASSCCLIHQPSFTKSLTISESWLLPGSRHAKRALDLIHDALPIILGQNSLELWSLATLLMLNVTYQTLPFKMKKSKEETNVKNRNQRS